MSKKATMAQWGHLSDVDLPELEGSDVMILIGSDMAHLLIHLEVRQGRLDEPIAIKTPLGWTLFGNTNKGPCETISANFLTTNEGPSLLRQIERFWEIDSYATKQALTEPSLSVKTKEHWLFYRAVPRKIRDTTKQHCYGNVTHSCLTTALWQFRDLTQLRGN